MHISDRKQKLFGIEMTSDHDHIYMEWAIYLGYIGALRVVWKIIPSFNYQD